MLQNFLGKSIWNRKINEIKSKVNCDKSVKDTNMNNGKAFVVFLPKQCLAHYVCWRKSSRFGIW